MATFDELTQAIISIVGEGHLAIPEFLPGEDVELPYVHLMPTYARTVNASDATWMCDFEFSVILCTRVFDLDLFFRMAAALNAVGITFEPDFSYDVENRVFMAIFATQAVTATSMAAQDAAESEG